jgi:hypothetical protein
MTLDELTPLLAQSAATEAFRTDLAAFANRGESPRISAPGRSPRVKVLRAIAQLLHVEPSLQIEQVAVRAVSGCADFIGELEVTDSAGITHLFDFEWNCEWKAKQLGYVDGFGFPDQIRAAQEFGWQCFERWSRRAMAGQLAS